LSEKGRKNPGAERSARLKILPLHYRLPTLVG
jgi:hypothetical protein